MRKLRTERLLMTMVVVLMGFFLITRFRPITENDFRFEWDRLFIYKTHGKKKYTHVVCGDSRVYRGVSASAIERNLSKGSVFNFGYSSGSFSSFMLEQMENKLDSSSSGLTLMLGITPFSLTPRASKDGHIRQELVRKREEVIEFLYLEPVKRLFEPMSVEVLVGFRRDTTVEGLVYQQPYFREGWVAASKAVPDPRESLPRYVRNFKNNSVSASMVDTLILKVKAWHEKGIHVYAFRPPTTIEMVNLEDSLSGFHEQEFRSRFEEAGGTWLPFSSTDFETYDGSHLTKSSAIDFSEQLGKRVDSIESRGREFPK